ncbi:uncharacterized protein BJ171DRAFT_499431 [Polychytrium aggregatum]|uniref:uncharacterized protein n=1 Tax=Polychytrium aggregatum TaxID=110093 RepID=UPI0022FEDE30|nr:uncharacterized protein BJ171DRAFT_499431 [Polychytrium aggregatum]KAI9205714.1 hypothetical protein BJ171DRAFT_499431 [Polychytrium aggregatum]
MAKSALKRKPTSPESKASSPIQKRYRALVTDNRFLDDEDDFSHYEYTPAAKPAPMPPTLKSTKGIAITVPGQAVSRKPEASPTLKPVSPRLKPSFSPRIKPMGSPRLASALEPLPPMVLADAADSEPSVIEVDNEELPISGFSLRQLIDSPFRRGKMSQKMMEYLESKKSMRRQSPALRSRSGTPVSERAASPMSIKSDGPEPAEDSDDSKQDIKPSVSSFGPQIRIVNGQIVVDEQSLMIADDAQSEIGEMEEVDESDRHITSASFSRKPRIVGKWTKEETRLFYDALSMFGTDFNLISKMFPGKNRTLLKRKYRLEERLHGSLVTKALRHRKTPDQDVLETMELRANQERSLREAEQQALGTLPDPQGQSLAAGERPAEEGPPASDSEERTELKNEIIQSTRDHASLRQVPVVGARSGPPVVASSRAAEPARTEPARAEPGTSRTETSAGPDADTAAAADGSQAESKTNQGGPDATEAEAATTKPTSSPAQAMLPVLSEKVMALISSPVSRMVGKGSRTGFAPKIVKKKAKGVPMKQDPAPTD